MANLNTAINIAGNLSASITSSALNCTAPLDGGVYAVWAQTVPVYIAVTAPAIAPSTTLTAATGYPIINGTVPVMLNVPPQGQIGAISTAAALLSYQKVN